MSKKYKVLPKYENLIDEILGEHPSKLLTMKEFAEGTLGAHVGWVRLQKEEKHFPRALLAYVTHDKSVKEGERTQAFVDLLYNNDIENTRMRLGGYSGMHTIRIMWNLYDIHSTSSGDEIKLSQDAFRWLVDERVSAPDYERTYDGP